MATPAAWPQDPEGKHKPCTVTSSLEDYETGWPAKCVGLKLVDDKEHTAEECADFCKMYHPDCSIWQLRADKKCYRSGGGYYGSKCWSVQDGTQQDILAGQRIQHGAVFIDQNLNEKEWVLGLSNIGKLYDLDEEESVRRCKAECYSDIECRYWQYGNQGCWVERAGHKVEGKPQLSTSNADEERFVEGQIITHRCLSLETEKKLVQLKARIKEDEKEEEKSAEEEESEHKLTSRWFEEHTGMNPAVGAGIAILACCIFASVCVGCSHMATAPAPKTRSLDLKLAPAPDTEDETNGSLHSPRELRLSPDAKAHELHRGHEAHTHNVLDPQSRGAAVRTMPHVLTTAPQVLTTAAPVRGTKPVQHAYQPLPVGVVHALQPGLPTFQAVSRPVEGDEGYWTF
eukprot:gnl/TRDRNA2_/TRDRNA2_161556_c0_seq1.p1 gnl/TRDRNA2_/TRDRNA2_161556_c0~~gnl/TRDRNA2_/TRDRNA2_161556_c0_seq1.p1  ORF type:complete len:444 (-),score=70.78 gnl/TRDRNA2_/TRDRNA2_161556_c0_seq1:76-1275(-)